MKLYYKRIWEAFINLGLNRYPDTIRLTCNILENTQHPITKFILYLHTLETFLYKDLKTASREKDK